jgi:YidC/Oxa1 family membrane protein insertase
MEFLRTALFAGLVIVSFMLWQSWQKYNAQHNPAPVVAGQQIDKNSDVPSATVAASTATQTQNGMPATAEETSTAIPAERLVTVKTDLVTATIDKKGGNVIRLTLSKYAESLSDKEPFILLENTPSKVYEAQSGIISQTGPDTHEHGQATLSAAKNEFVLADGQDTLVVPLTWQNEQGVTITKNFTFTRNSYLINVSYDILNKSAQPWSGQFYMQFKRDKVIPEKQGFLGFSTYLGAAISSPDKRFEKLPFDTLDDKNIDRSIKDGWLAMVQHYFVSAWIPNAQETYVYRSNKQSNGLYSLSAMSPVVTVGPGEQKQIGASLYSGPEVTSVLKKIAPKLELTVDYGWFWPISQGLFWVMKKIYDVVGNWGWSIVLVTLLIKLAFYKLSATSYRSMAQLKRLQPKLESLKERYADDKQKLSTEMMALYKKEKINPLGGCLPILIQIPVFIALYWVLIESVELRQAPFILWIQDLSVKDPYYVLPVLMGISMFVQQKLSPPPADPTQAKVMMFLPVIFTVLFVSFPAGLVLYWVVNNVLSIAQQWFITRQVEEAGVKNGGSGKASNVLI